MISLTRCYTKPYKILKTMCRTHHPVYMNFNLAMKNNNIQKNSTEANKETICVVISIEQRTLSDTVENIKSCN